MPPAKIAESSETGSPGVRHLRRFWSRTLSVRGGHSVADCEESQDKTLLAGLRLNILETLRYLTDESPDFEVFEVWVLARNDGALSPARRLQLNAALEGNIPDGMGSNHPPVLSREDIAFWDEHGYVVVHDAVPPESRDAAAAAIYEFLGADPRDPETWYNTTNGHSIWVPLLRHAAFQANRESPRVHRAFAQLWGRDDLWATIDQGGLNPPERANWKFPGPHLHWDTSIAQPIPFGVQGILYLTDTAADQGAFTCVPGFHRTIGNWLKSLPEGANPRQQDMAGLAKPIAGRAGDLIVWHHALPHGSSPNRNTIPRVVQYLTMFPSQQEVNPIWK
jgi:hypothetical protein